MAENSNFGIYNESNNPSSSQEVARQVLSHSNPIRKDSDLLQRIIDEKFLRSVQNFEDNVEIQETIRKLYSYLEKAERRKKYAESPSHVRSSRVKDVLQNLSPRYRDRYQVLMNHVDQWRPVREDSITKMSEFINKLDRNFKWSTVVRFVASSVDVSGSVGGMLFRSETSWVSHALNAASFCGLCGLVSTVAEVEMSKRILDEVSDILEKDRELLQPVLEWFEESEELDSAVRQLFPYALDTSIVRDIKSDAEEVNDNLQIFKALLLSNVRQENSFLHNNDFLHSIQLFAGSEVGQLWWNRVMYRRHPIILDSSRMALQMEFGQIQSIIFQCIPALPLEQQRLTSLPVAGRIMLNLLTMYDSLTDLNKGAKSMHSDKMRRLVEKMTQELNAIVRRVETQTRDENDG